MSDIYSQGTVSVATGSHTVTGDGTFFLSIGLVKAGSLITFDEAKYYRVVSVVGESSLTIEELISGLPFQEPPLEDATYTIVKSFARQTNTGLTADFIAFRNELMEQQHTFLNWVNSLGETYQVPDGNGGFVEVLTPNGLTQKLSQQTYVWPNQYADDAAGTGISDNPEGKAFVGYASGKSSPDPTGNPADYTWHKAIGPKGKQGDPGKDGGPGADGTSQFFHLAYAESSDGLTGFNFDDGTYTGTYVDASELDSSDPERYKWRKTKGLEGRKGEKGIPGVGVNGETTYLHIAYANSPDGFTDFNQIGGEYIGTYTDFTELDSADYRDYVWKKHKGDKGSKGDDAFVMVLSNEAHTVPADVDGSNPVLDGAITTVSVLKSDEDLTDTWTVSVNSIVGTSGNFAANTFTAQSMTADAAYVDFIATKAGQVTLKRRFTLTKAKKGDKGPEGPKGDDGISPAEVVSTAGLRWGFKGGSSQGWTARNGNIAAGLNTIKVNPIASDTGIMKTGLSFAGDDYYLVRVKVRATQRDVDATAVLYYSTTGHNISSSYYKSLPVSYKQGEWQYLVFDMRELGSNGGTDWVDSTITTVRVDPYQVNTDFEIDGVVIGYSGGADETDYDDARVANDSIGPNHLGNVWSTLPSNGANKVELDSDTSVPGRARFRRNDGQWEYIDVYSGSDRTKLNRLRSGKLPDSDTRLILDRDLASLNTTGRNAIDGRARAVRPDSDYKNSNTTKAHVGLPNVVDGANKVDIDGGGAEGQMRRRVNNGSWTNIDVFSGAERTKLDRLRLGRDPAGNKLLFHDGRKPSKNDVGLGSVEDGANRNIPVGQVNFVCPDYYDPDSNVPLYPWRLASGYVSTSNYPNGGGTSNPSGAAGVLRANNGGGTNEGLFVGHDATDYNIYIPPRKKWLLSAWVQARNGGSGASGKLWFKGIDGGYYSDGGNFTLPSAGNWYRVGFVVDLTGKPDLRRGMLRLDSDIPNQDLLFDGLQLSEIENDNELDVIGLNSSTQVIEGYLPYTPPLRQRIIKDGRQLSAMSIAGLGSTLSSNVLTSNGGRMTVAAHTLRIGGRTVNYSYGTVDGSTNRTYYVTAMDFGLRGGDVSYSATQTLTTAQNHEGKRLIGKISTSSGSSSPDPGFCVHADMWLTAELQAGNASIGGMIDVWERDLPLFRGPIQRLETDVQDCVELVTENGCRVIVSLFTPVETEDGTLDWAANMRGHKVYTDNNGVEGWSKVISADPLKDQPVIKINVGDKNYAAGVNPTQRIVTHNATAKP